MVRLRIAVSSAPLQQMFFSQGDAHVSRSDQTDVETMMGRREALSRLAAVVIAPTALSGMLAPPVYRITVYKDAGCGCCKAWVTHMTRAGFVVTPRDVADINAIKAELGVPQALWSCHTGVIGSTIVEGHVPAATVLRFLAEKAPGQGIAVPGMPSGSPGMEGPNPERYEVLAFGGGKTRVYSREVGRVTAG
jgi:hypothetical protein